MRVLSIDPGSKKCGISVVEKDLTISELRIVRIEDLIDEIIEILEKYDDINVIVIGDKTASSDIENRIKEAFFHKKIEIVKVEEEYSTQEGKEEFIRRKGFWKSIFKSNFDEWASYILAKRFFRSGEYGEKKEDKS